MQLCTGTSRSTGCRCSHGTPGNFFNHKITHNVYFLKLSPKYCVRSRGKLCTLPECPLPSKPCVHVPLVRRSQGGKQTFVSCSATARHIYENCVRQHALKKSAERELARCLQCHLTKSSSTPVSSHEVSKYLQYHVTKSYTLN